MSKLNIIRTNLISSLKPDFKNQESLYDPLGFIAEDEKPQQAPASMGSSLTPGYVQQAPMSYDQINAANSINQQQRFLSPTVQPQLPGSQNLINPGGVQSVLGQGQNQGILQGYSGDGYLFPQSAEGYRQLQNSNYSSY